MGMFLPGAAIWAEDPSEAEGAPMTVPNVNLFAIPSNFQMVSWPFCTTNFTVSPYFTFTLFVVGVTATVRSAEDPAGIADPLMSAGLHAA